jgi:altronate hydrolase
MLDADTNPPIIRLNENDNVAVARRELEADVALPGTNVRTREIVPPGYKVAVRDIAEGEAILKYNTIIGFAARDLQVGEMLHNHNIAFQEFDRDYAYATKFKPVTELPEAERATFQGYKRSDGRVGTRNFIAIVSTVNCSATVVHAIADHFTKERLAAYPNVDGVAAFAHAMGCGMEMTGEPMDLLHRWLLALAASVARWAGCSPRKT